MCRATGLTATNTTPAWQLAAPGHDGLVPNGAFVDEAKHKFESGSKLVLVGWACMATLCSLVLWGCVRPRTSEWAAACVRASVRVSACVRVCARVRARAHGRL